MKVERTVNNVYILQSHTIYVIIIVHTSNKELATVYGIKLMIKEFGI